MVLIRSVLDRPVEHGHLVLPGLLNIHDGANQLHIRSMLRFLSAIVISRNNLTAGRPCMDGPLMMMMASIFACTELAGLTFIPVPTGLVEPCLKHREDGEAHFQDLLTLIR